MGTRAFRSRVVFLATLFLGAFVFGVKQAAAATVVEVDAGAFGRDKTPICVRLPETLADAAHLRLTRLDSHAQVPVQRVREDSQLKALWILDEPLPAGQRRRYRLEATNQRPPDRVTCTDDGRHLVVSVQGHPVLRYNQAVMESPEGLDPVYRRSGYIHPIFDPAGREVTGDFPPDHAHQHALFFAWVNTTFRGQSIDFWNQAKNTGMIEHVRTQSTVSGPVCAAFTVSLRHRACLSESQVVDVLNETWTVRVYSLADSFLFDLVSRQQCVAGEPLVINEYHYGGMALRGAGQWFDPDVARQIQQRTKAKASAAELARISVPRDYLTSEGKTWIDGNGTRARWVEMHGPIDARPSGIVVMGHPDNLRAPQPVRLHPHKPYFCFAPMILGQFSIEPGKTLVSRYRYYVHTGDPDAETNDRLWNDFARPPTVSLQSDTHQ